MRQWWVGDLILVTGATGFVGWHVCEALTQRGHRVIGLARRGRDIGPWNEFVELDLSEAPIPPLSDVTAVVHAAGLAHDFDGAFCDADFFRINVLGSAAVGQFCLNSRVLHLVNLSSIRAAQTGSEGTGGAYALSKWMAEGVLSVILRNSSTGVTHVRPSPVYGPRGSVNMRRLNRTVSGPVRVLAPADSASRSFIDVRDLSSWIVAALETRPAGIFPVSDGVTYRLRDLQTALLAAGGRRGLTVALPRAAITGEIARIAERIPRLARFGSDLQRAVLGEGDSFEHQIPGPDGWLPKHDLFKVIGEGGFD